MNLLVQWWEYNLLRALLIEVPRAEFHKQGGNPHGTGRSL